MGYDKFRRTQKKLIELGLIERIQKRNRKGQITGWYILVNFVWKRENSKFVLDNPLRLDDDMDTITIRNAFQEMKRRGENSKIYKRDNWKCTYCGSKVVELKKLYKQGESRKAIAKFVKNNPNKVATIDHIIPLVAGGGNNDENLTTSCLSCNCSKRATQSPELSKARSGKQRSNALNSNNRNKKKTTATQERSLQYYPLAKKLSKIVQAQKNIHHTPAQLKSWANDIRQLVENNLVDAKRIKKALNWYEDNVGGEYIPVIESGSSLRTKFTKLEDAMGREGQNNNKPLEIKRYGMRWELGGDGKYRNYEGTILTK